MTKRLWKDSEETKRLLKNENYSNESDDSEDEVLYQKYSLLKSKDSSQYHGSNTKIVNKNLKKNILQDLEILHSKKYEIKKLKLERQVTLLSGVSIIVGSIIGSGIFISPKGVLQYSGSVPLSLVIWIFCGIITLFGALSYAELGTFIPLSGGDYIYLLKAFEDISIIGPIPAFLFMWTSLLVFGPSSSAILSLTVAEYVVEPLYSNCSSPIVVKKLVAILCICIVSFINCASVKLTTGFNNIFTATKLLAIGIIIVGGIIRLIQDDNSLNAITSFDGSTISMSNIATAIYFGMWAYGGWNSLNNITEEIIEPEKNILRAIAISIPLVTLCYALTNISYLSAMSSNELLSSDAVAVLFANKVFSGFAPVVPILVAASAFGCAISGCLGTARLTFVAAREGHLINILSYIHVQNLTPIPAILFNSIIAIIMCVGNFESLINFLSFTAWLFFGLAMIALLYMRKTKKDIYRPYKVPILFPIIMLIFALYLVIIPIIQDPRLEYLYAILFIVSGVIFFIPFVYYKKKLYCLDKLTMYLQLLLNVAPTADHQI